VPSRVIHQRQLYGDESDSFRWLELVSSYILGIKKPDQVSDQAVLVNVRFTDD
jgi:hypothetical protein